MGVWEERPSWRFVNAAPSRLGRRDVADDLQEREFLEFAGGDGPDHPPVAAPRFKRLSPPHLRPRIGRIRPPAGFAETLGAF